METLPLATVKAQLSSLVDQVEDTHQRVVITRNGKPAAMLISLDDIEGLEETLEILSDNETMKQIRQSHADIKAGRVETLTKEDAHKLINRGR
ncbi:MAG TPA: type II toxin-antitoxin system Phd/YefM family antitoxin [Mycobacteriales bacterium]|nr:type II toxin-antitoxin system Phd/YefM family antitoxin [Mycobacteriales bacterium]